MHTANYRTCLARIKAYYVIILSVFLWCSFLLLHVNLYHFIVDDSSQDLKTLDVKLRLSFHINFTLTVYPLSHFGEGYSV